MAKFSVKVGDREVIGSGSITTGLEDDLVTFLVADLIFEIRFLSEEGKEFGIRTEEPKGKSLRINLINFDNPLGTSFDFAVGTINGRLLNLAATVQLVGTVENGRRAISYTFSAEVA